MIARFMSFYKPGVTWELGARLNWGYSGSSGAPPFSAARRSFSARSYHKLCQGIRDINLRVDDIDHTTQQIQSTINQHIDNTTQSTPDKMQILSA